MRKTKINFVWIINKFSFISIITLIIFYARWFYISPESHTFFTSIILLIAYIVNSITLKRFNKLPKVVKMGSPGNIPYGNKFFIDNKTDEVSIINSSNSELIITDGTPPRYYDEFGSVQLGKHRYYIADNYVGENKCKQENLSAHYILILYINAK